jgi:hypothetical protein
MTFNPYHDIHTQIYLKTKALYEEVEKEMEEGTAAPFLAKKAGIDFKDLYDRCHAAVLLLLNAASIVLVFVAIRTGNYENPALSIVHPLSIVLLFLYTLFDSGVPGKKHIARMMKCSRICQLLVIIQSVLLVCCAFLNIGCFLFIGLTALMPILFH